MHVIFGTTIGSSEFTMVGFSFFDETSGSYHVGYHAYNRKMQRVKPDTIPEQLHKLFLRDVEIMLQGLDQYR